MPEQPTPASYLPPDPGGATAAPPRVTPAHRDLDRAVRVLHQRWVTVVDGCFETEMECGDGEPVDALRDAWAHALEHSGEVKAELDTHIGEPIHDELTERHLVRLALASGLMRPGHTVREGLQEVERVLRDVQPLVVEKPTWFARRRRSREERRLIIASMRGY